MEKEMIDKIINDVMLEMNNHKENMEVSNSKSTPNNNGGKIDASSYPLGTKRPDLVRTPTNKSLDEITLESLIEGRITIEDLSITANTLELQAQVAESAGRGPIARNFRRAAELTLIPDARVLEIYNALRPNRSTKQELIDIANELKTKYNALITAGLVLEAADVYEKRKKLRIDD